MKKLLRAFLWITFAFYVLVLIKLLFLDRAPFGYRNILHHINLVPFKTLHGYVEMIANNRINFDVAIKNLVGNLILFFPMGILLPCLFSWVRGWKRFLLVMLGMLLAVELLQLMLLVGTFDVDDLLLNLIGAVCGFALLYLPFLNWCLRRISFLSDKASWS